jgi:hypothetical protein
MEWSVKVITADPWPNRPPAQVNHHVLTGTPSAPNTATHAGHLASPSWLPQHRKAKGAADTAQTAPDQAVTPGPIQVDIATRIKPNAITDAIGLLTAGRTDLPTMHECGLGAGNPGGTGRDAPSGPQQESGNQAGKSR